MKTLLIIQAQDMCTIEQFNLLREDIMISYENNKPIVLPSNVNYEIVELSEMPIVATIK